MVTAHPQLSLGPSQCPGSNIPGSLGFRDKMGSQLWGQGAQGFLDRRDPGTS